MNWRVFLALAVTALAGAGAAAASPPPARPCPVEMGGVRCGLNDSEVRLFTARRLGGSIEIYDVRTGAPAAGVRVMDQTETTRPFPETILPLSAAKLWLAAAYWREAEARRWRLSAADEHDLHELIATGSDEDGRRLALALRQRAGSAAVLADLTRFGEPTCPPKEAPAPGEGCTTLSAATSDADWAQALSVGEAGFTTTPAQLSRFLSQIGAPDGRTLSAHAAAELQSAMLDTVSRGTAVGVQGRLRGGWRLGGKTGAGPAGQQPYDGCFVGLAFDPTRRPRYTVAVYVRRGGTGGGAAAEIAADALNQLLGL